MAEFLIRNRRSSAALDVWEPMAGRDARSFIHASAWSKLSRPLRAKVKPPATDDPQLQRLVTALVSLPRRNFYDVEGFGDESELPDLEELFWLSLLELIRTGNFVGALDAKAAHKPRGGTYNPVVFRDLCQVLHYRVEGEVSSAKCPVKLDDSAGQLPYVTNQLDALETLTKSLRLFKSLGRIGTKTNANSTATTSETVSEHGEQLAMLERQLLEPAVAEVVALLDERAIFPAVLLAGGWAEAALLMTRPRAEVPRWLQSQWIAALQTNRSREDVVAYIESLAPLDESREVLLAESIVPIEERRAEAIAVLKRHSGKDTVAGLRAAYLLVRTQFEAKQWNACLSTILANSAFALSVPGHELAARVYMAAGDEPAAISVLRRLKPHSSFAREFLATVAWRDGHLDDARDLVVDLVRQYPERDDLRVSLAQILAALGSKQGQRFWSNHPHCCALRPR